MTAFVTDGQERPALAITRSLGRQGIEVVVGSEHESSLAGASRYCARQVTYPSPRRDHEAFEHFLVSLVSRERIAAVIPVGDVTTRSVIAQQDELRSHSAAVAVPNRHAFETVTDKIELFKLAVKASVPVPRTVVVNNGRGLGAEIHRVEFPAVVKSFSSRIQTPDGWIGTSAHHVQSRSALERLYLETGYLAAFPSLIQERVEGPGVGLFGLFDRGQLIAAFGHRRLREKPPSGGVSVLRESVPADPELVEHAMRLLGPLGWHGVAMVEFKRDRRSGHPFLIEINGRFWGSLQLAVDAGLDFPFLTYRLARGLPVEPVADYRVGVRSRWLLGDLDHLLLRIFRRNRDQHLPEGAPSRVQTLVDFMNLRGRDLHYEVLRRDDPRPFLHEVTEYVKHLVPAIARRAGRHAAATARRRERRDVEATTP